MSDLLLAFYRLEAALGRLAREVEGLRIGLDRVRPTIGLRAVPTGL